MKSLFELHSREKDIITREDVLCVQIAALCHDLGELGLLLIGDLMI